MPLCLDASGSLQIFKFVNLMRNMQCEFKFKLWIFSTWTKRLHASHCAVSWFLHVHARMQKRIDNPPSHVTKATTECIIIHVYVNLFERIIHNKWIPKYDLQSDQFLRLIYVSFGPGRYVVIERSSKMFVCCLCGLRVKTKIEHVELQKLICDKFLFKH